IDKDTNQEIAKIENFFTYKDHKIYVFLQVNIPQGYQLDSDPNLDEINLFEENTSKVSKSKNNYVTTLNFRQDNYGLVKKIILNLDYSSILPL
ncbi:hypothetical protein HBJ00_22655, partial [Aeromonas veronii]|nr:hypothetical protein [Aeromonas veronii]